MKPTKDQPKTEGVPGVACSDLLDHVLQKSAERKHRDSLVDGCIENIDTLLDIIASLTTDAFWSEQWRGRKWTVNLKAVTGRKRLSVSIETVDRVSASDGRKSEPEKRHRRCKRNPARRANSQRKSNPMAQGRNKP